MPGPLKGVLRLGSQHVTQEHRLLCGNGILVGRAVCQRLLDTPLVCVCHEFVTILEADATIHILWMRKLSC